MRRSVADRTAGSEETVATFKKTNWPRGKTGRRKGPVEIGLRGQQPRWSGGAGGRGGGRGGSGGGSACSLKAHVGYAMLRKWKCIRWKPTLFYGLREGSDRNKGYSNRAYCCKEWILLSWVRQ